MALIARVISIPKYKCRRFLNWLLQGCTLSSPKIVPQRFSHDLEKRFCEVFVICFIRRWMKRSKHGLFVFPPKKSPDMEKALFDWPVALQYDVKAKYRFLERSLHQPNAMRVCIRSITNPIALFPFVCYFCFVRAFSFQGHKENRPGSK